jgi:hypothetical protein
MFWARSFHKNKSGASSALRTSNRGARQFKHQFGSDMNSRPKTDIDGALAGKETVHPVGGFPVGFVGLQLQSHMDAPDDENAVLEFDFTHGLRYQPLIRCIDLTRLQRASVGSRKSTGSRGHHIIQGGRVRLQNRRRYFVMFRYRAMHAEDRRLCFRGKSRSTKRPFNTFDPNF